MPKPKTKKVKVVTHRIPFANWRDSQLSIARHYGGCVFNGKQYTYDPEMLKKPADDGKFYPDLVTYD